MPTLRAYYNEFDVKAAAWLRELIKAGHIASGDVDDRSIQEVRPDDLRGYAQCHFFAGIGGWSYALRLAGWPDDRPVWTGSCPCQPFSVAGKGAGFADERHLWPAWFHLITQCRPQLVFGEQVANALAWLDVVQSDLENESYAVGATIIGAHSVGAPHIRQRLYWVADSPRSWRRRGSTLATELAEVANIQESEPRRFRAHSLLTAWPDGRGSTSRLDSAEVCSPSYGVPGRMGLLRGYGNAIVPQVAAEFIGAYLDIVTEAAATG